MQLKVQALAQLEATRKFFDRTTRCLAEADSGFRATPETWSVAHQVAHVAHTIDWFRSGVFDDRWDTDFEAALAEVATVTSLGDARDRLARAWKDLHDRIEGLSDADLESPMADNPILGARPRYQVVEAVIDHTAHHRGSLAVYGRLLGRVPDMPYVED